MGTGTASLRSNQPHTAVIGDMLDSRNLSGKERMRVQIRFTRFIEDLNRNPRYSSALLSKFAITLGDEFHGILKDASVLPDLLWDVDNAADLPKFRIGVGYGRIDTEIPPYAINLDGPALHHAREAIDVAKSEKLLGGVFSGFGEEVDKVANGIARLLWFHMDKRTEAQRSVIGFLRQGFSQTEIAGLIRKTPQAVTDHKIAAGWDAYHAGEQALCAILKIGTTRPGK
ncbi:MAG: SatD family protein [Terracidiphilus sp.]